MVRGVEETVGPVVIVGGHRSLPVGYRGLARILSGLSGAEVYVVPVTPLDWVLGRVRGYGQIVFEVASAVDRALLESSSEKVVLVGHSEGGLLARIFIGGESPFGGRRYAGHRRVSHLITLGTPHVPEKGRLADEVNDLFPGALHDKLRYLCVAGDAGDGASSRKIRGRYEHYVRDGRVRGDGEVPVQAALLPGSEHLVIHDLYHGRLRGLGKGRWYGSDQKTVERWWPEELRVKANLVREPWA